MNANRHDPLDADERELARVLRALPAGEPPSALDARILAMGRDAVVTTPSQKDEAQPRTRSAPRLAWGLGVAASCAMAAGLVWRMGGFGGDRIDGAGAAASAAEGVAAESSPQPAPPMPDAASEAIHVEISPPRVPTPSVAPPPPSRVATTAAEPPAAAQAASAEGPRARLREPSPAPRRESAPAAAAAPPAPMADAARVAPAAIADESSTPEAVVVTGSRIVDVVQEDGRAGAQVWIQRIRARIAAGDEDGARKSLQAFIERHPAKPLPQDLIDFQLRAAMDTVEPPGPAGE